MAVAQQRPSGERARGIDGDHADLPLGLAVGAHQAGDERRLAGARRSGDADPPRAAGLRPDRVEQRDRLGAELLHLAQTARQGLAVAAEDRVGDAHSRRRSRAMTIFWTSVVPS
jgi:hypothetical protein